MHAYRRPGSGWKRETELQLTRNILFVYRLPYSVGGTALGAAARRLGFASDVMSPPR